MAIKTYVLLPHTQPVAPIYNVINKQRHRINQMPMWRPNLQYTFMNEDGRNVTIRFKLNSNTIYLDNQVKDENLPANAKFTTSERNALKFVNGALVVRNPVSQKFLDSTPHFSDFSGTTEEPITPYYTVYDKEKEVKSQNDLFKKTVKAAIKIEKMNLKAAQKMLIAVNGIGFTPPESLAEAQNLLVSYMDSSEEAVDDILKNMPTESEFVVMLVGRLVANSILSFEAVQNEVSLKKGNGWVSVKSISSTEYTTEQRHELFCNFLLSTDGANLKEALEEEEDKL